MDMFTSYRHIKKPNENYCFFMILAWLCRFKILHQNRGYDMTIGKRCSIMHLLNSGHFEIVHNYIPIFKVAILDWFLNNRF